MHISVFVGYGIVFYHVNTLYLRTQHKFKP